MTTNAQQWFEPRTTRTAIPCSVSCSGQRLSPRASSSYLVRFGSWSILNFTLKWAKDFISAQFYNVNNAIHLFKFSSPVFPRMIMKNFLVRPLHSLFSSAKTVRNFIHQRPILSHDYYQNSSVQNLINTHFWWNILGLAAFSLRRLPRHLFHNMETKSSPLYNSPCSNNHSFWSNYEMTLTHTCKKLCKDLCLVTCEGTTVKNGRNRTYDFGNASVVLHVFWLVVVLTFSANTSLLQNNPHVKTYTRAISLSGIILFLALRVIVWH